MRPPAHRLPYIVAAFAEHSVSAPIDSADVTRRNSEFGASSFVSRINNHHRSVAPRQAILAATLLIASGCQVSSLRFFHSPRADSAPSPVASASPATLTPVADPPSRNMQIVDSPSRSDGVTTPHSDSLVIPVANTAPVSEEVPAPASAERSLPLASENVCRLDMSTALALVAGQNPQVGYARWRIREAYADLERAQVLWLPSIQAGASYHHHEGVLQDSAGSILNAPQSSLQTGLGAGAVGAGTTPSPGIVAQFQLVDAIFQPAIAQRNAWAQEHARDAVLNDQLLEAAIAYQELLRARQLRAIALQTVGGSEQLVRLTTDYANAGQGTRADADRSQAELALRKNNATRSEEAVAVASARLAQVLSMSNVNQIVPVEESIAPIDLMTCDESPQDHLAVALGNRPELKECRDLVAAACERLRRERYAPLVPSVLLGASYDGFGGGVNDTIGDYNDRADFDAVALWQIRNLGYGEQAARQAANARLQQESLRQVRVMDTVARDVAEAEARVRTRRGLIATALSAVEAAHASFERNFMRIREGQGLPIEVLQAIQSLDASQRELVDSTADYNIAQFQLQRALGWPVQ